MFMFALSAESSTELNAESGSARAAHAENGWLPKVLRIETGIFAGDAVKKMFIPEALRDHHGTECMPLSIIVKYVSLAIRGDSSKSRTRPICQSTRNL
jgi:hypothetical protein